MRRPLDSYRITGDTKEHAQRGVGPATDYAAPRGPLPIGTPVRAPFPIGRITRWGSDNDPGGRAITATSPNGRMVFVGQHLDRYASVTRAAEGDVIAYSGDTGTQINGAHLHCYVIVDGVRMSMEEFIQRFDGTAAGDGSTPFNPEEIMNANQEAKLDALRLEVGVVKQLLTETEQWKGIGWLASETFKTVGVVKQLLTETEQWKGIGWLVSETYKAVGALAATVAEIAAHTDGTDVDPAVIAELKAAVDRLAVIDFPTEATIVDAIDARAKDARIAELEAELSRLAPAAADEQDRRTRERFAADTTTE